MGLLKDIAGVALAPATGGASLAMTGRKKRNAESGGDLQGPAENPGSDTSDDAGSDDSFGSRAKRFGRRLAQKRTS